MTEKEEVLRRVQQGISLVSRPYEEIAMDMKMSEERVLSLLDELVQEKAIRSLAPIYDTRTMGYDSALVAFEVEPSSLEEVAAGISEHPGVSHNYERPHQFNLWFTLAVSPDSCFGLDGTVRLLARQHGVKGYSILRAKKTFKIGVKLDPKKSSLEKEKVHIKKSCVVDLSALDREMIRLTQGALPLDLRPFSIYAERLMVPEETLLERLRWFASEGVLRRVAAIAFHRKLGFHANGMAVWQLTEEQALEVGPRLAAFSAVSHCYLRETSDVWRYNLFAMVHGKQKEDVYAVLREAAREFSLPEALVLFSVREFKKKRILYFSEDAERWESNRGPFRMDGG